MRIFCHEIHDLVLDLVEILVRLRRTDDQPRHPHRMHGHAGRGHDQTFARRYGQRDADGMPAAEHERDRRLLHPRDQLRNGESRLDVPADRVQKQQQTVDVLAFLHGREQGNDVLILGRLDVVILLNKTPYNLVVPRNGWYALSFCRVEKIVAPISPRYAFLLYPKGDPEYKNTQLAVVDDVGYILAMNTMALKHECIYNMTFIASKSRRELDELQRIYRELRVQFEALKQ